MTTTANSASTMKRQHHAAVRPIAAVTRSMPSAMRWIVSFMLSPAYYTEPREIRDALMAHDHDHDDHHGSELSEMQLRVRALETVLAEKGYIDPAALDAIIEAYETKVGPHNGARVVAKAWSDPAFKKALVEDASKAIASLGLMNRVGDHLIAVENTPK